MPSWTPRSRKRSPRQSGAAVSPREVDVFYDRLLGRPPGDAEVEAQLQARTLGELLDVIVGSEEFRLRWATAPARSYATRYVNMWTPENARFTPAPGTISPDGVAEVGREGVLFLRGGTNDNREQFAGRFELPERWEQDWAQAVAVRTAEAERLGVDCVWLTVPDKLACDGHLLTEPLPDARRPVQQLLDEVGVPMLYPVAELRAVRPRAFLRTDSHLALEGNRELARIVLEAFGAPAPPDEGLPQHEILAAGDLGGHFDPPLVEVFRRVAEAPMEVVEDNHVEIFAVGGHLGTRSVLRNASAPDPRTIVVFGDSYGFGSGSAQGLAWWLALALREVHFVWLPFGWDSSYIERVKPDLVVVQGAERFCVRAPAPDSDTLRLGEETLRRRRGIDLGELGSPA
ncbi:MAG: hypothetical protein ACJ762_05325 [Solirubrobacteraceae bacterium]